MMNAVVKPVVPATSLPARNAAAPVDDAVFLVDPSIKARRREAVVVLVCRVLVGVAAIAFWQWASGRLIREFWISSPSGVIAALAKLWQGGTLLPAITATVSEAVAGFFCGAIAGMLLGLLFGANRTIARVLDPYVIAFYSIPRVALIPLFVLWFGIGFQTKVIFTALLVFFPVFMNTLSGVRDVNRDLIDVIRVMGATRLDTVRKILVPSALVWLFAGLRISVPYALIGAVVGEMFTSNAGLGYLISLSASQFDTGALFATLLVVTVLGLLLTACVTLIERRMLRWQVVAP